MIKNLIFDFGKVLVDYDFEAFFRKYIPQPDRYMALGILLNNPGMQDRFDREDIPVDEMVEELIRQNPELERELRLFTEKYPEIVTGEMAGMRELLSRLKAEGYKIYGLTNWCSKVHETMAEYEIFQLLDGQVISSEEHLIKPEAEIYHRLLQKFSLKADECVFTDDKQVNIVGAKNVGIHAILFKDARQYEAELRALIKTFS